METYVFVFFGAALVAQMATPYVARLARLLKLTDAPGPRKVHRHPIPRVGGIAIVAATLAMVVPVLMLDNVTGQAFRRIRAEIVVLLAASVFMFAVGLVDDIRGLTGKAKFFSIMLAATAVYAVGGRIDSIGLDGVFEWELGWLSLPLTILWIATVTVAMNFIDGLDGLAAGIAAVACGLIALFAFYTGQTVMGVLMLALLGSLVGFLFFNFNPAKIFMGDCGSMFLGFTIAAGSVVCTATTATLTGLALPAAALGVPLVDAVFTIIRRRVLDRRSMFSAERGHIHHRLLDAGLNHRRAVYAIYGMTLLGAGTGVLMLLMRQEATLYLLLGAFTGLLVLFHLVGSARLRETLGAMRRNSAIAQQVKAERQIFEDMQLQIRVAHTFDEWWDTLCAMADAMEFDHLALVAPGSERASAMTVWRRENVRLSPDDVVRLMMPLGHGRDLHGPRLDVAVRPLLPMETIGRRMMLFGRLLDEFTYQAALDLPVAARTSAAPAAVEQPSVQAPTPADSEALPAAKRSNSDSAQSMGLT